MYCINICIYFRTQDLYNTHEYMVLYIHICIVGLFLKKRLSLFPTEKALQHTEYSVLRRVAVCCSVLQCAKSLGHPVTFQATLVLSYNNFCVVSSKLQKLYQL